jgi:hypothetical protein
VAGGDDAITPRRQGWKIKKNVFFNMVIEITLFSTVK